MGVKHQSACLREGSLHNCGAVISQHSYHGQIVPCRLYWDNGALVMLTSALIMSCGALAVALIDDRVPVFEIVVCLCNP